MVKEMTDAAVQRRRIAGPVRITIPARIAYNPGDLKKSIASIAEQIGHPRCFSGADCFFQMERQFALDRAGVATAVAGPDPTPWSVREPDPDPWKLSVGLSSGVKYNLDKVLTAVDKVIDLIGPHPCISGFDVLFRDELELIVVNEKLEAQRFGQQF